VPERPRRWRRLAPALVAALLASGVALPATGRGVAAATPVAGSATTTSAASGDGRVAVTTPLATTGTPTSAGGTTSTAATTTTTTATTTTSTTATTTVTTTATATTSASTSSTTTGRSTAAHTTRTAKTKKHPKKVHHVTPPGPLTGWLSDTTAFPQDTLVLGAPRAHDLASHVSVQENGQAVSGLQTTSAADPGEGDVALSFAVDDNASMSSSDLTNVFSALRLIGDTRSGLEAVGLVTFSEAASVVLPPTIDSQQIADALQAAPARGSGADADGALETTVDSLQQSGAALGIAVVISDGVGVNGVADGAAARAHVPVIIVGLKDSRATATGLRALRNTAPGTYIETTPAQLAQRLTAALKTVTSEYAIARWRSSAPHGKRATVTASASGVSGSVALSYLAPAATVAVKPAQHRHHAKKSASLGIGHASPLSPSPSFTTTTGTEAATTAGFWHSGAGILVIALLVALLVGAAVMLLLRRPAQRGILDRVGSYTPMAEVDEQGRLVAEQPAGGLAGILQNGSFWPAFVEGVEVSRNPRSPSYLMKRAALVAVVVGLLFAVVTRQPAVFFVPVILSPFVERWWVLRAANKQRALFRDSLPGYMQDMASAIRVGRSFVGALAVIADSADEPSRSEFDRAVTDESLGRPLDESLAAVGQRMHSDEMGQLALIAELNRRSGSNVAEALDRVADGARERADLGREMRALTAQAKMSSSVLTGMPIVLLLALSVIAPKYSHPLFHTAMGWVSICFAALFLFVGWKVMKKISNVGV
jgi:Flp pilus assembly protein TadB